MPRQGMKGLCISSNVMRHVCMHATPDFSQVCVMGGKILKETFTLFFFCNSFIYQLEDVGDLLQMFFITLY